MSMKKYTIAELETLLASYGAKKCELCGEYGGHGNGVGGISPDDLGTNAKGQRVHASCVINGRASRREKTMSCTCGVKFRDAEDFRDHEPCPGTSDQQEIAALKARVKKLEDALLNTIGYAEIVGSQTDDVHIACMAYAKKALKK